MPLCTTMILIHDHYVTDTNVLYNPANNGWVKFILKKKTLKRCVLKKNHAND